MLVQLALIVFALCGVLSLIIDVGYARITQGQMQIAADTAALEGVRNRDHGVVDPATGQTVNDPFFNDCLRRREANLLVHWVFDDDLNANGDPDYQFGARPIIDLTDGVTSLHAAATISAPDPHVYKPDLQINQQDNAVHGDMVSGTFFYSADPAPSEDSGYARNDFNPSVTVPQPPGGLSVCPPPDEPPPDPWPLGGSGSLANDDAFLVRLRRSNEQAEPSVASSGPSLPLVFGRGTTILGDDPSSAYSVRRDGLTIRATAIAQVRPALHIGLPQTNPSLPGVAPFTVRDTFAQTLNASGTAVTINPANGVICSGAILPANIGTCIATAPIAIGRFVGNQMAISTVGQALPPAVAVACASANAFAGYGPVYSPIALGTNRAANRIIGFARIGLGQDRSTPARAANPCAAVVSHGVPLVAPWNATANLIGGLPLPADAQPADVTELLCRNLERTGDALCPPVVNPVVTYGPVLVPVLAR